MFLARFLNIPVFIVSLLLGMYYITYLSGLDRRKIYIYPTPENVDYVQYKDKVGTCFEYRQQETPCPADATQIATVEPQV